MINTNRVKTGIPGFDKLVQGGIPRGASVLLAGAPGTGKSIFALQYLYNGITKYKERALYINLEQHENSLIKQAAQFGWNLKKLIKEKKLVILTLKTSDINDKIIDMIKNKIRINKIKRVVIDSLTTLSINAPIYKSIKDIAIGDVFSDFFVFSPPIVGDLIVKRFIYGFLDQLHSLETTNLLISGNMTSGGGFVTRDTISEFLCDGILQLSFESMGGEFSRTLLVRKMRHTKNNEDIHPLEISKKGITIHELN